MYRNGILTQAAGDEKPERDWGELFPPPPGRGRDGVETPGRPRPGRPPSRGRSRREWKGGFRGGREKGGDNKKPRELCELPGSCFLVARGRFELSTLRV